MFTSLRGKQGRTGQSGSQGDTGAKGDTGDTGAKGDKGDKGDQGDAGVGVTYVDRGDIAAYDTIPGLAADDVWRTWDLSGIIDENAKLVFIRFNGVCGAANKAIRFRTNGNNNDINTEKVWTGTANHQFGTTIIVKPDSNRVVEYNVQTASPAWSVVNIAVSGWIV